MRPPRILITQTNAAVRTHADPLATLPLRRFQVRAINSRWLHKTVKAITPSFAKQAGAVLLNLPASALIVVELSSLNGSGMA